MLVAVNNKLKENKEWLAKHVEGLGVIQIQDQDYLEVIVKEEKQPQQAL
jgi:hypothetical protein